jgi:Arf-GAP with SH3 domain, ANK repeat and PH domain-containing protein
LLWALSKPGSHIDPKGINKQAWHKFWIVLDQGKLSEYSNWKDKLDLHREPIDLRVASVRMARDADRRFCFEVITPQYKRVYQATSEEDMNNWIQSINNALQSAVEGRSSHALPQNRSDQNGREYGTALTGKSSSQSGAHGYSQRNDAIGVSRRVTVGARPSYVRTTSSSFEDNPSKLLEQIRKNDQGNSFCADCGSNSKVEWVCLNLGILLCIECGGIHRSLGTHISKIRSLTLDVTVFSNDLVELLMLIGNRISNMVWEANLDQNFKPNPSSTRDQRLKFITAKYVERAYVEPTGQFVSPDDNLLTSIKKNDVQNVLKAIAQRANVNAHDRSRDTHAVFLALAAADPAQLPGSPGTPTSAPATNKAFPIAELLVQNGADIPTDPAPIPLSAASKLYVKQRTAKAAAAAGANDTLGPLPNVSGKGIVPMDSSNKLQKRGSSGARFAGKVTGIGER